MQCHHCGSDHYRKNGSYRGVQRYICKGCGRSFTANGERFDKATKAAALDMHLNNVGIRKIARFTGASPAGVLKWIKKAAEAMAEQLDHAAGQVRDDLPDVIEMDENLHLRPKKQCRAVVWTAYSRRQGRIVAHHVGDKGVDSAIALYRLTKRACPAIAAIFTDANSCYRLAFERHGVTEPHVQTKAETHLIEAQNASMRDNLARFNRRSKRHSKTFHMLDATLTLFFNRHLIGRHFSKCTTK